MISKATTPNYWFVAWSKYREKYPSYILEFKFLKFSSILLPCTLYKPWKKGPIRRSWQKGGRLKRSIMCVKWRRLQTLAGVGCTHGTGKKDSNKNFPVAFLRCRGLLWWRNILGILLEDVFRQKMRLNFLMLAINVKMNDCNLKYFYPHPHNSTKY